MVLMNQLEGSAASQDNPVPTYIAPFWHQTSEGCKTVSPEGWTTIHGFCVNGYVRFADKAPVRCNCPNDRLRANGQKDRFFL